MPFTLAHPAAVLPLRNRVPRILPWSALVIGSMTPDFHYFLLGLSRDNSHSLPGLFRFCLPVGMVAWLLFHTLMKRPLTLLLPDSESSRLWHCARSSTRISIGSILAAGLAILVGASTHVIWDAFTHGDGWGVARLPELSGSIVILNGYNLTVFRVLQHGSTLVGLMLLARAYLPWRGDTAADPTTPTLSRRVRLLALVLIVVLPAAAAFAYATAGAPAIADLNSLRAFVWRFVTSGIGFGMASLVIYSLAVTVVMARSATTPR